MRKKYLVVYIPTEDGDVTVSRLTKEKIKELASRIGNEFIIINGNIVKGIDEDFNPNQLKEGVLDNDH